MPRTSDMHDVCRHVKQGLQESWPVGWLGWVMKHPPASALNLQPGQSMPTAGPSFEGEDLATLAQPHDPSCPPYL